jgi:hypothetical protein
MIVNMGVLTLSIDETKIKRYTRPREELRKGEKVVGKMNKDERKLYSLYMKESTAAEAAVKSGVLLKEGTTDLQEVVPRASVAQILGIVLYVKVAGRFGLWGRPVLYRKGFKIATSTD